MQVLPKAVIDYIHYKQEEAEKTINRMTKVFFAAAFCEVVGACCFRNSLSRNVQWMAATATLGAVIFIYSINKLIKNVQDGEHCHICAASYKDFCDVVADGNIEAIKYRLARGANVNMQDEHGLTPLHYADQKGDIKVIELLLDKGATRDDLLLIEKTNQENKQTQTPLNTALQNGRLETVEALLKEDTLNVHSTNEAGEPFIHCLLKVIVEIDDSDEGKKRREELPKWIEIINQIFQNIPINIVF